MLALPVRVAVSALGLDRIMKGGGGVLLIFTLELSTFASLMN